jgi:hypothetical protein
MALMSNNLQNGGYTRLLNECGNNVSLSSSQVSLIKAKVAELDVPSLFLYERKSRA